MAQKVVTSKSLNPERDGLRAFAWKLPEPSCPIATKVWVQSIAKGFLTLQPLLHMKNGKKVQKCQHWDIYTKEALRSEQNGI